MALKVAEPAHASRFVASATSGFYACALTPAMPMPPRHLSLGEGGVITELGLGDLGSSGESSLDDLAETGLPICRAGQPGGLPLLKSSACPPGQAQPAPCRGDGHRGCRTSSAPGSPPRPSRAPSATCPALRPHPPISQVNIPSLAIGFLAGSKQLERVPCLPGQQNPSI